LSIFLKDCVHIVYVRVHAKFEVYIFYRFEDIDI